MWGSRLGMLCILRICLLCVKANNKKHRPLYTQDSQSTASEKSKVYHVDCVACVYCKTLDFSIAIDCVSCVYKVQQFLFLAFNNQVNCVACI